MTQTKQSRICISLPPRMQEQVKAYAVVEQKSISSYIREALQQKLNRGDSHR